MNKLLNSYFALKFSIPVHKPVRKEFLSGCPFIHNMNNPFTVTTA